jgi:hypothetical protein
LRAIAVVMGFFRDEPPAPALGPFEMFLRISSHDLRRTFGTWLRADGVPVSEVAAEPARGSLPAGCRKEAGNGRQRWRR